LVSTQSLAVLNPQAQSAQSFKRRARRVIPERHSGFADRGTPALASNPVGASRLVVGSDYPYPWTRNAVDLILQTPGLTDVEKIAMLGGTAAELLGIQV
jgi:hypothetical protein